MFCGFCHRAPRLFLLAPFLIFTSFLPRLPNSLHCPSRIFSTRSHNNNTPLECFLSSRSQLRVFDTTFTLFLLFFLIQRLYPGCGIRAENKFKVCRKGYLSKMSVDIQRNGARGSSATAATDPLSDTSDLGNLANSRISTVTIASEWHFKPAGVMEVEKRFAKKRDRMRAVSVCHFNSCGSTLSKYSSSFFPSLRKLFPGCSWVFGSL